MSDDLDLLFDPKAFLEHLVENDLPFKLWPWQEKLLERFLSNRPVVVLTCRPRPPTTFFTALLEDYMKCPNCGVDVDNFKKESELRRARVELETKIKVAESALRAAELALIFEARNPDSSKEHRDLLAERVRETYAEVEALREQRDSLTFTP